MKKSGNTAMRQANRTASQGLTILRQAVRDKAKVDQQIKNSTDHTTGTNKTRTF